VVFRYGRTYVTSPSLPSSSSQLSTDEAVSQIVNDSPAIVVDSTPKEEKQVDRLQSETRHDANQDVFAKGVTANKLEDEAIVLSYSPVPESRGRYSYTRLPEGRYTRVILLQPARDHREPLQIKLEHLALEDDPDLQRPFDALSYVWGNADKTELIFCDGHTLLITPNCGSAMRHLRNKKSPSALWIDAICIDQDSLIDRNHQVSLMGEIYKAANHVFIWLGSGSPEVDHAIVNIQRMCALRSDWGEYDLVRMILFRKFKGLFFPFKLGNVFSY